MKNKLKAWLIRKLGGYTAAEAWHLHSFMLCYINYVREQNPILHDEADGKNALTAEATMIINREVTID